LNQTKQNRKTTEYREIISSNQEYVKDKIGNSAYFAKIYQNIAYFPMWTEFFTLRTRKESPVFRNPNPRRQIPFPSWVSKGPPRRGRLAAALLSDQL
jgi:hypothetical protein